MLETCFQDYNRLTRIFILCLKEDNNTFGGDLVLGMTYAMSCWRAYPMRITASSHMLTTRKNCGFIRPPDCFVVFHS